MNILTEFTGSTCQKVILDAVNDLIATKTGREREGIKTGHVELASYYFKRIEERFKEEKKKIYTLKKY